MIINLDIYEELTILQIQTLLTLLILLNISYNCSEVKPRELHWVSGQTNNISYNNGIYALRPSLLGIYISIASKWWRRHGHDSWLEFNFLFFFCPELEYRKDFLGSSSNIFSTYFFFFFLVTNFLYLFDSNIYTQNADPNRILTELRYWVYQN